MHLEKEKGSIAHEIINFVVSSIVSLKKIFFYME